MHDRFDIRRSPGIADSMGIAGGVLVAAGILLAATGIGDAAALVGGLLTLTAGLFLLAFASLGWERAASRSRPLGPTAVRWSTSPRPAATQAVVPLRVAITGGAGRRRVVSLPYGELPAARR